MYTFSHGFWAYLLFRKKKYVVPFVLGTVLPDFGLLLSMIYLLIYGQRDPSMGWIEQIYLDPRLYLIDEAFHSLIIWGILLIIGFSLKHLTWKAFVAGAIFHILIDILTHQVFILTYLYPYFDHQVLGIVSYKQLWFTVIDIGFIIIISTYLIFRWYRRSFYKID